MNQPFDINQVPINYTLNAAQVGVILRGLGKLPLEEVEQLFAGIRSVAQQTLQQAEEAAKAAAAPPAEEPLPTAAE